MIGEAEMERELGLLSIEQEARTRYSESETDHSQMVAKYARYHHYMYPPHMGNEGSGDQWPDHARANPDKIHITANIVHAFVAVDARLQAILPRVTIPTARMDKEKRALAEATEGLVLTWLEASGWDVWMDVLCLVKSGYGKGVLKPFWNAKEKRGDVYVLEQPQNLRIGWGRSDYTVMDWALYEMTMSVAEAKRRYKNIDVKRDDRNPDVLNVIRLYEYSDLVTSGTNVVSPPYRMQSDYEQKHLTQWDYWWIEDGKVMNAILLNGTVVEGPKPHPEMPTIPYIVIENDHEMGNPDGVSTAEPILDIQVELNRLMSHAHQHVADTVDPAYQASGEMEPDSHIVPKGGELQWLGATGQILPIQTGTNTVPFMDLIRDAWNSAHRITGLPEILFGQAPADISGRATAIQIQSAINRIDPRRKRLYDGLRGLIRFWLHMAEKVDPHEEMADGTMGSMAAMVKGFDRWRIIAPEITPRDIAEVAQVQMELVNSKLSSAKTAMDQVGIEAPEAEMDLIREERSDVVYAPDAVMQTMSSYQITLQLRQMLQQMQMTMDQLGQQAQQVGGAGMSPVAQGQRAANVGQQQQFQAQPQPLGEDVNQPSTTTGSPPPPQGQGPEVQNLIRAGGPGGGQALTQAVL